MFWDIRYFISGGISMIICVCVSVQDYCQMESPRDLIFSIDLDTELILESNISCMMLTFKGLL